MGRNERKNIELEKTIPDLPENKNKNRSSKPPAKWRPFQVTPREASSIEPINKNFRQNPGPEQKEKKQHAVQNERFKQDLADRLVNATIQGDLSKVRVLVDEGADPNEKDTNGKTAMQYAGFMGRKAVLEFFESIGQKQ